MTCFMDDDAIALMTLGDRETCDRMRLADLIIDSD